MINLEFPPGSMIDIYSKITLAMYRISTQNRTMCCYQKNPPAIAVLTATSNLTELGGYITHTSVREFPEGVPIFRQRSHPRCQCWLEICHQSPTRQGNTRILAPINGISIFTKKYAEKTRIIFFLRY